MGWPRGRQWPTRRLRDPSRRDALLLATVPASRFDETGRNSYHIGMTKPMRSTVSEKGQVTIPKTIRARLGIEPGEVLEFEEEETGGRIVAHKVAARDPVDEVYGILRLDEGTDELVQRLRGETEAA